jgi:hypothetical protein
MPTIAIIDRNIKASIMNVSFDLPTTVLPPCTDCLKQAFLFPTHTNLIRHQSPNSFLDKRVALKTKAQAFSNACTSNPASAKDAQPAANICK